MLRFPALLLAAASAAGCAGGWLSSSDPEAHARALRDLHDDKTFRHVPDVEETRQRCVEEIRALGESDYATWRQATLAVFVLSRASAEDPTVLGRSEAVHALEPLGAMLGAAEEPAEPREPLDTREAFRRLAELHVGPKGLHAGAAEAAECADLVECVGRLRFPLPVEPKAPSLRERKDALRLALVLLLAVERSPEAHEDADARAGIDRAAIRLAAQVVRIAVAEAALFDEDDRVRYAAAGILGTLPGEDLGRTLARAYRDERNVSVRRQVVGSLGLRAAAGAGPDRDAAIPALLLALDDDDRSIRFHAREALKTLSGEDFGDRPEPWKKWWTAQGAAR